MTQAVDVPLLNATYGFMYPLLFAARSLFMGLVVGAVVTFVLVKLLGRLGVAARWRVALATGVALFLAVTAWSWLSSSDYTWVRVTAGEIELRYATWPRPARRIAFDQVESVSMSTSGRRGRSHHLVIFDQARGPARPNVFGVGGGQRGVHHAGDPVDRARQRGTRAPGRRAGDALSRG